MAGPNDRPSSNFEQTDILSRTPMLAGKYELGRLVGEGGMGAVYEANHIGLGAKVAVKLLGEGSNSDPKSIARFKREAKAMGQIRHPNVVQVMDTGTDEMGLPYLVMELLEGESLSAVLRREKRLAPAVSASIISQVLSGLGAAHAKGVVHRDLKPGNVFISRGEGDRTVVKILDFGISKLSDSSTHDVTAAGALVGTPNFMAPEQIAGANDLDSRIDLYAVGVLLYRMLCGNLPFVAQTPDELYRKILNAKPVKPRAANPALSEELEAVVLKAMAPNVQKRFQTCHEFREALIALYPQTMTSTSASNVLIAPTSSTPTVAEAPAAIRKQDSYSRSWKQLLALSAATLVFLAMFGFAAMRFGSGSSDGSGGSGGSGGSADSEASSGTKVTDGPTFKFAVTRYLPEELVRDAMTPLEKHLEKHLGMDVELVVVESFDDIAEEILAERVQMGALSSYAYVRAHRIDESMRLLAKVVSSGGTPSYQGYILTRATSDIVRLKQLEGRKFCYVSETSTSGYLYPRALFRKRGVNPDKFQTFFGGNHLRTLQMLAKKTCDGAAVYASIFFNAKQHGMAPEQFRVLDFTDEIPYDAYVVGKSVDEHTADAVRNALLELRPGSDAAKTVFSGKAGEQITGFVEAKDSDYDGVRGMEKFLD